LQFVQWPNHLLLKLLFVFSNISFSVLVAIKTIRVRVREVLQTIDLDFNIYI